MTVEKSVFEFGEIPENIRKPDEIKIYHQENIHVSQAMDSLKLKLHGENYFSSGEAGDKEKNQLWETDA